jgi:hypothetical protein
MTGIKEYDTYVVVGGIRIDKKDLPPQPKPQRRIIAEAVTSITDTGPESGEHKKNKFTIHQIN